MDRPSSSRRMSAIEIASSPPRTRRASTQAGPSGTRKRRRLTNQTISSTSSQSQEQIESIDLTEVDGNSALAKVLAKQREDAIAAQEAEKSSENGSARSRLTAYTCPICMDTPTDATASICGHLFCHRCITDWLKSKEEQLVDHTGKAARAGCPKCRKPLARADTPGPKRNLVPLQIKLVTKKRADLAANRSAS
ncbi:hypothetical protein BJY04DRAFT_212430 [Aspergillus karnatakaensis]|uniref:uncharacterized protein n=1 Tax=Aspergillus karnatakaensis TaxID=1810916 RepID=UPI003CCCA356